MKNYCNRTFQVQLASQRAHIPCCTYERRATTSLHKRRRQELGICSYSRGTRNCAEWLVARCPQRSQGKGCQLNTKRTIITYFQYGSFNVSFVRSIYQSYQQFTLLVFLQCVKHYCILFIFKRFCNTFGKHFLITSISYTQTRYVFPLV